MNAMQEAIHYIVETHIMFSPLTAPDKRYLQTLLEVPDR